jgi:gluconate kinase
LLKSQFETLEEPGPEEHAIVIQLGRSPRELVREIKRAVVC